MNSVDMFFQVVLLFFLMLSSIMVVVGLFSTISTLKAANKGGFELDFNVNSFFIAVVMPILYIISFVLVYTDMIG